MPIMLNKRGITFAAGILVIFTVAFIGFLAYMAVPTAPSHKTYFEDLSFTIDPYQKWHVGVPIMFEGTLEWSFNADTPVRVYAKYSNMYLVDKVASGPQDLLMKVDPTMSIVEIAIVNLYNATITVNGGTCTLTS